MNDLKIPFRDIPAEGKNLLLDNPIIWEKPIQEFNIGCQIIDPLNVKLFLLPIQGGCLIKGNIIGSVNVACDCCTEDVTITINNNFEIFETSPEDDSFLDDDSSDDKDLVIHDESRLSIENYVLVLDVGAICWEEFLISLPLKPLCQNNCKGLCAKCGANLNKTACTCSKDEGDPRLAILRNYKIKDKK